MSRWQPLQAMRLPIPVTFRGELLSQHWLTLFFVSALTLGIAGCGEDTNVAPVEGIVFLDGAPLVGASVNTQPIATSSNPKPGSGSFGKTDEQGHYSLRLIVPLMEGAILGEHRVTITRADAEQLVDNDVPDELQGGRPWPGRYSDGSLRLTVSPDGNTQANYELTLRE